jgi:glutathione S-transferase
MDLVALVAALAVAEYSVFTVLAGQARGRHGVPAPATTGHPTFERYFRVQENTIEQLVIFLPAIFLFAHYVSAPIAAGLGAVFITGRLLYARAYVTDPARRGPGFLLTFLSNVVLLLGGAIGALLALF